MKTLIQIIIMIINYHNQPTGNTCGPTCIKMAHTGVYGVTILSIPIIAQVCGTDWVVGTPPEKMVRGLDFFKLKYHTHIGMGNPFEAIETSITNGNISILRTLTQGVPHWIIVVDFKDEIYDIYDPWLGKIKYTKEQLIEIWSPREYFYFEIYK